MSKKVLIVVGMAIVLLAVLIVPVMAALPSAGDTTPAQSAVWPVPGGGPSVFPPDVQLSGDCEVGNIG